jgi:antitoxin (DNA-binding transcriptional repressor) of toxin-antitoxin stability system
MAVADARAELRRTLELAENGSVVLTNHGEPEAALIPFATIEDMRRALLQLLLTQLDADFKLSALQTDASKEASALATERELDALIADAIREGRQHAHSKSRKFSRK